MPKNVINLKGVCDAFCGGGGCCGKILKLKRAILMVCIKNGVSDVASQFDRNVLAL